MFAVNKHVLVATFLSMATTFTWTQTADTAVAVPTDVASSPEHVKAKHRKPMHVERTQPKTKKHHANKEAVPATPASAAE